MSFIRASWSAPDAVVAGVSNRYGGVSLPPFNSFNLALHVGDDQVAVNANRALLAQHLRLPAQNIQWLDQVHGGKVIVADRNSLATTPRGDALVTAVPGIALAIMTADCLPILLTDPQGKQVAAIHAGWRSLVSGVIDSTVAAMHAEPQSLLAWLGPAIGPRQYEVGEDVKEAFLNSDFGENALKAFKPVAGHEYKYYANLYRLAKMRLRQLGVTHITGRKYCTLSEQQWFSYRRDGETGRMASFIMIR
ncbi:MAG: peptidoglycan editing factor PgeF [Pseudomonadales bacterium]|nr:peptidoglycan editing factor PgeF [Pseudomonadales bacterium]